MNKKIIIILAPFIFWILFLNINQGYYWDEVIYLGLAKNLRNGDYFVNTGQESFRPPLFPYILSFFYPLGELYLRFLVVLFAVLGSLLVYFFVSKIYNERIAIISSLFLLTSPMLMFFGQRIMTETLFLLLFTASVFVFYFAFEKDRRLTPLVGFLVGLSFLTRYTGILLILIFFIYLLLRKDWNFLKYKEFFLSIIIFLLVITPFFIISYTYYGDPFGSYKVQMKAINPDISPEYYSGPWYYHIVNSLYVLGLPALFVAPFLLKKKNYRNRFSLLLIITIFSTLIFFSFMILRKEMRDIVPFSSIFLIGSAISIYDFKLKRITLIILISIIVLTNLIFASFLINQGIHLGENIKKAAEFIKDSPDEYVMAENYPVVSYISDKKVIEFPEKEEFETQIEKFNITYIIVDFLEVTTPDYAFNLSYDVATSFGNSCERKFDYSCNRIIIYKVT